MNYKQFATDNARTQAEPHGLVRAGNSIEWYKCGCGEQSNLLWTYKTNKDRILACSLDCAVRKATGQIKLGYFVDDPIRTERCPGCGCTETLDAGGLCQDCRRDHFRHLERLERPKSWQQKLANAENPEL